MRTPSKCVMAKSGYCRKALREYCNANDEAINNCPYLNAIGEVSRLSAELAMKERLEDDGK